MPGLRAAEAMALVQAAQRGTAAPGWPAPRVLEGRHVAVVASSEADATADVFAHAARALGARTALIAPIDLGLGAGAGTGTGTGASDTARLLGRLYAAIGCSGLEPDTVALLQRSSGVPVLHDLAADTHASRLLADLMTMEQVLHDSAAPPATRPRLGVQGRARSALLRAWKRLGAAAGVHVIGLPEPQASAQAAGCDFVCRPGSPPELLDVRAAGLRAAAAPASSLSPQQRQNHCLVVQLLLRNELGARH
jgi:ornithine carbamoyltransferase